MIKCHDQNIFLTSKCHKRMSLCFPHKLFTMSTSHISGTCSNTVYIHLHPIIKVPHIVTRYLLNHITVTQSVSCSTTEFCRPRWLSWMRRPTGDQEVAGSTPAEVGNILSWRLIMKYFLRSFSSFRWFKKGSCQFLAKECAQYWLTA